MTTTRMMETAAINDARLVAASLAGDREAFGQIVVRYQSLVCSLAYSATGSLGQSEDLAQETFLTAWKELRALREPEKLRAWLCGIARRIVANAIRHQGREPVHSAEPLEEIHETAAPEALAPQRAISREEEAILWRSLEKIPDTYREPLVLFYREGQSVEGVAGVLGLSEDAVKQRLSRGRKLLAEEVSAFVEGALRQSAPGRAFTFGVLAALPALVPTATAAALGTAAAKTGAAAKSFSWLILLNTVVVPIVGVLGAWFGFKASLDEAKTPRERRFVIGQAKLMIGLAILFAVAFFGFVCMENTSVETHRGLLAVLMALLPSAYVLVIFGLVFQYSRGFRRIRAEERATHPEAFAAVQTVQPSDYYEYRSRWTLLGLPLIHICFGLRAGEGTIRPAVGWIAIGAKAVGVLFACGGVSVGLISVGGAAAGLIALGGVSLGALAAGGIAIGGWAFGGAALGYAAGGASAIAWHAAHGAVAVARDLAQGGLAIARHANDSVSQAFFRETHYLIWESRVRDMVMPFCWLPMLLFVWHAIRRGRQQPKSSC